MTSTAPDSRTLSKWLKDRKGTELDFNAIIHYSNILYVLAQTIYISKEIEKIYI